MCASRANVIDLEAFASSDLAGSMYLLWRNTIWCSSPLMLLLLQYKHMQSCVVTSASAVTHSHESKMSICVCIHYSTKQ